MSHIILLIIEYSIIIAFFGVLVAVVTFSATAHYAAKEIKKMKKGTIERTQNKDD